MTHVYFGDINRLVLSYSTVVLMVAELWIIGIAMLGACRLLQLHFAVGTLCSALANTAARATCCKRQIFRTHFPLQRAQG